MRDRNPGARDGPRRLNHFADREAVPGTQVVGRASNDQYAHVPSTEPASGGRALPPNSGKLCVSPHRLPTSRKVASCFTVWSPPVSGKVAALRSDAPQTVEERIRALVPEVDDLKLRRRLRVKYGMYDEMLTNMNRRQIEPLGAPEIRALNRVFNRRADLLEHFGYRIMEPD